MFGNQDFNYRNYFRRFLQNFFSCLNFAIKYIWRDDGRQVTYYHLVLRSFKRNATKGARENNSAKKKKITYYKKAQMNCSNAE